MRKSMCVSATESESMFVFVCVCERVCVDFTFNDGFCVDREQIQRMCV